MQSDSLEKNKSTLLELVKFLVYWAFLLFISMPHGLSSKIAWTYSPDGSYKFITPAITPAQILSTYGGGDMASYCRMAIDFAAGTFTDFDYWHMRLFPPGLTLLEAGLIKLLGPGCPMLACLSVITCGVWAFAMCQFSSLVRPKLGVVFATVAPFSLCLSGVFINYLIRAGLIMTESLSTAELCIAFMFLLQAVRQNRTVYAVCAGVSLALAAYTRGQNEFIGTFLTPVVFAIALLLLGVLIKKNLRPNESFWRSLNLKFAANLFFRSYRGWSMLALAMIVFTAMGLPYRICNKVLYDSYSWMQADRYFEANWRKDSELTPAFVGEGITVAAKVNPELAQRIQAQVKLHGIPAYPDAFYKTRSITTFLRHPIKWMNLKWPIIVRFWFEDNYKHLMRGNWSHYAVVENWAYTILIVVCIVRFILLPVFQRRFSDEQVMYFSFYSILVFLLIAVSILYTCEERYFYTMKIATSVLFLLSLAGDNKPNSKRLVDNIS